MSKILYETKGSVAKITINRPEAMNAFDLETARVMAERLQEFDADAALRVAIITGAGDKAFCAGADLKKMHGGSHDGGINELWDFERQNRLGQRLQTVKPVIAAVNGYWRADWSWRWAATSASPRRMRRSAPPRCAGASCTASAPCGCRRPSACRWRWRCC